MSSRCTLAALLVFGLLVNASSANAQETKPATADSSREVIAKCLRTFANSRSGDRASQIQRKVLAIMSDQPALDKFSTDYARLANELTAATARKDSTAMNKLTDEINALLTLDAKADSLAGAKKCGVLPPPKPPTP